MGLRGKRPGGPYILRAARRRGCASEAQDKVSPRGKAPGRFWPPYAGGHSYAWEVFATDRTGFSNVSHFAGQNGTLIRRPRWRARASEMRRAGKARPRGVVRGVWSGVLVGRLSGAPPPCPPRASARQCRERKRSNARSAMSKAIRRRDERPRHAQSRKRQHPPPTRTKAVFSLESEGFLFDKTKRNPSELGRRQLDHWPRRALTSSKRLSIRRWASSLRAPKLSPRARVASSG